MQVTINGGTVLDTNPKSMGDLVIDLRPAIEALFGRPIGDTCECSVASDLESPSTLRQLALEVSGGAFKVPQRHALLYDPADEDDCDYVLRMIERFAPREGEQRSVRLVGVADIPRAA